MWKRKTSLIWVACGLIILMVVAFVVRGSLRRPEKIVLPPEPSVGEENSTSADSDAVRRVEVRPDTVQSVIEALVRPAVYSRTVTVERYWDGGSSLTTLSAREADGWLRLDEAAADGQARHVITGEGRTYIWYGESKRYYSGAAAISQDAEQGILTYEAILALPTERIAAADYRSLEEVPCIYVETAESENGYVERYWVSVDTGLLTAAERLCGEEVIYRMAALKVQSDGVDADAFTLPDGTVLHEPGAAEDAEESREDIQK